MIVINICIEHFQKLNLHQNNLFEIMDKILSECQELNIITTQIDLNNFKEEEFATEIILDNEFLLKYKKYFNESILNNEKQASAILNTLIAKYMLNQNKFDTVGF